MSRTVLFSAIKNEGPFLLEWIAYHKIIGFTDIIFVANDCTDGSVELLETLQDAGEIQFIEQDVPADISPQTNAERLVRGAGLLHDGDWIMWLDADEFLFPNTGDGKVQDLIAVAGNAAAIMVAWRFFGDSGNETWPGRHVSPFFTRAGRRWLGRNAQVKTLFRFGPEIERLDIHRPILKDDISPQSYKVITSSGSDASPEFYQRNLRQPFNRMTGAIGPYRLGMVAHFSIRTPDLFLEKARRGDGYYAANDQRVVRDQEFYRKKNLNESEDASLLRHEEATVAEMKRLLQIAPVKAACNAISFFKFPELETESDWRNLWSKNAAIQQVGLALPALNGEIDEALGLRLSRYLENDTLARAALEHVGHGDHVLEIGVGILGAIIAKGTQANHVATICTDPLLSPFVNALHAENEIKTDLHDAQSVHLPEKRKIQSGSDVQDAFDIAAYQPDVVVFDVESCDLTLLQELCLSSVRTMILTDTEIPEGAREKALKILDAAGLRGEDAYFNQQIKVLTRNPVNPAPRITTRGASQPDHNIENARFAIPTCMKNEAPYLLEWLAYHQSIGVQDFIVFSNHCTDGTDLMLDRLDELGIVTHLPNPAALGDSTYYQSAAMKFAVNMPQVKRADYVIQTDVDEFINIHAGSGHLKDLLKAAGPFHVFSISELNFSSSGRWEFEDGWITEQFQDFETLSPGHWQARRGVKSIIHGLDNFSSWPVHRPGAFPGTFEQLIWLDGSGAPVPKDFVENHENGIDRRGRYDLAQLDHHALRSVQAFLMKKKRGDVAHHRNSVDIHYFRQRSIGGNNDPSIRRHLPRARVFWEKLMQDNVLSDLHKSAVAFHKQQIRLVEHSDEMAELRQWIAENYFPDRI